MVYIRLLHCVIHKTSSFAETVELKKIISDCVVDVVKSLLLRTGNTFTNVIIPGKQDGQCIGGGVTEREKENTSWSLWQNEVLMNIMATEGPSLNRH